MQQVTISDAEWQVMNVVWREKPLTGIIEIIARLEHEADWAPATVKTMLHRLVKKGVLTYDRKEIATSIARRGRRSDCIRRASRSFSNASSAASRGRSWLGFYRTSKTLT